MIKAMLIEVIEVTCSRGIGNTRGDPCRTVIQYWSKEGVLLAENDPVVCTNVLEIHS